jgi:hypothetical protein
MSIVAFDKVAALCEVMKNGARRISKSPAMVCKPTVSTEVNVLPLPFAVSDRTKKTQTF